MAMYSQKDVDAFVKKTADETKKANTTGNSYGLQKEITKQVLNCPDYIQKNYKENGETAVAEETKPVQALRDELAKTAGRTLGLDKADVAKLSAEMEFSQNAAQAFNQVSDLATMKYLETGHKKTMPAIDPDMARMGIYLYDVPSDTKATTKIVEDGNGGHKVVPTGKVVTTAEHTVMKTKNGVRPWQKTAKPAK